MAVFFQLRICVCRKHLAVGINVYAFSFRLLQKHFQIPQVMPGHNDKRAFFHFQRNGCRSRCSVGFGVSLVQHFHAKQVFLSYFHHDGQEFFHAPVFSNGKKSFSKETVYFFIFVSQNPGVAGIGSHSTNSEKNQRFQRTHIFICSPKL